MRARNRELFLLIPASLLVTAGFAGVFIQYTDSFVGLFVPLRPAGTTKTVLGRHQNGVEQPTLRKPLGGEFLKAYAKRKHRHERSYSNSDAESGKSVAK